MRFEVTLSRAYADPSARSGQSYETVSTFEIEAANESEAAEQAGEAVERENLFYSVREVTE